MTNTLTSEQTIALLNQVLDETAKELGCENDNEAILQAIHDLKGRSSLPSPPVSGEPWGWAVPTVSGHETATRNSVVAKASRFAKPLYTSPLTNGPIGVTETWQTACDWLETTFGPIKPERIITRAKEEFEELESAETLEQQTIEAADVVMCLMRFPGLWEALVAKMAVNRARTWELRGDGTGYHVKNLSAAIGEPRAALEGET